MNEAAFEVMLDEWGSLSARRSVDLAGWQRTVDTMQQEERTLRAAGRWVHGRDDFFGVLGVNRAEIRHSRIIAWLLDPCARHGLGVGVLHGLILQVFGAADAVRLAEDLFAARTACEAPVDGGRLDIVVEAPGLYLVIENKVDAPEGDQQCDRVCAARRGVSGVDRGVPGPAGGGAAVGLERLRDVGGRGRRRGRVKGLRNGLGLRLRNDNPRGAQRSFTQPPCPRRS